MSNAPSTLDTQPTSDVGSRPASDVGSRPPTDVGADRPITPSSLVAPIGEALSGPVEFAGFWLAVALPFVYVPVLVGKLAGGKPSAFALLLALHAVSLVVGHGYRSE